MDDQAPAPASREVVTVTLNPAIDQTVTIPNFAAGIVNRVERSQSDPGGKGVNVAAILSDYGYRVAVTGFLGRDNTGLFETLFARKHIEDSFLRIAGQTRVGIKISDPALQQTTDINFPGQAPTPEDVALLFNRLAGLDAAWYVLSGSVPPGLDAGIYADLAKGLKQQGRQVLLDTSGEPLARGLAAAPHIIKPNFHELEALLGQPLPAQADVVQAAQTLLDRGIRLVVVSMGGDGALFVNAHEVVVARPPHVAIQSTVGAGDAMVAGIVAAQLSSASLADCARLATAFSLDRITHLGSGLSSAAAVEAFMQQVTIT